MPRQTSSMRLPFNKALNFGIDSPRSNQIVESESFSGGCIDILTNRVMWHGIDKIRDGTKARSI